MSPEQIRGEEIDGCNELWAFGSRKGQVKKVEGNRMKLQAVSFKNGQSAFFVGAQLKRQHFPIVTDIWGGPQFEEQIHHFL